MSDLASLIKSLESCGFSNEEAKAKAEAELERAERERERAERERERERAYNLELEKIKLEQIKQSRNELKDSSVSNLQSETAPVIFSYFVVNAEIKNSMDHSGYRKRIYEDAQIYRACYNCRSHDHSIWYPDGSKDLHITLLFSTKEQAHDFLGCLINYNKSHTLLKERIEVHKHLEKIDSAVEAEYVFKDEYVFDESDSPANTRDDISSVTEVAVTSNPIYQLRSLEDLSKLAKFETAYRCHIAPKAFFKEHKSDPDNILYGSHLFHNYFDGDGKRRPAYAHPSWGVPPRLKIQYDETGPDHMFQGVRYHLIQVVVTFDDPEVARAMDGRWREGSSVIDDLSFRTHFYTTNVANAIRYLSLKQKETEDRWAEPDDFEG